MNKLIPFLAAAFVAVIFLGNFVFLINNSSFYSSEFSKLGINATDALNVVSFVNGKSLLGSGFNAAESSHLEDVKNVLAAVRRLYYAAVILLAAAIIYLFRKNKFMQLIPKAFVTSGAVSLLLLMLFFLLSLNFSAFFGVLHAPFFQSGTWLFPVDSFLIQLFPQQFFHDFARNFFLLVLVNSSAFVIIGFFVLKKLAKPSLRP